ncbi:MAG: ABC transporter ATP-binding protein [Christensenellales bacterium]
MADTMLKVENLTKQFGGLTAVNDLSLTVERGVIHALIGPNGSGKTTTLSMIAGALEPTSGKIFYNDTLISDLPAFKVARHGVGRTFQNIRLFPSMTTLDNVMVGGHNLSKVGITRFLVDIHSARSEEKQLIEKAEHVLDMLDMLHLKDEYVKNLPYGRQKVLELGRTMMSDPDLILLDEPAAGLNPTERADFVKILVRLHEEEKKTLFLIEHNMDVVMTISERITVLNFGKKIAEGSPKEIQDDDEVIKAYLGERYKKQAN